MGPFLSGIPVVLEMPLGSKFSAKKLNINNQGILVKCGDVNPQGPNQGIKVYLNKEKGTYKGTLNPGAWMGFSGDGMAGPYKIDMVCNAKAKKL